MKRYYSDQQWLDRVYQKSNAWSTQHQSGIALRIFDYFCKYELKKSRDEVIKQYQQWFEQQDIESICMSLDGFVNFMTKDHPEIKVLTGSTFKKKSPKTIKNYFGFIKSYLRFCFRVKLSVDDVKDSIQFPTQLKESREPISLDTLKKLFDRASPKRRALFYVLVSILVMMDLSF